MKQIEDLVFSRETNRNTFLEMLEVLDLRQPLLIKPNWGTSICFTEAKILDWTLDSVDGDALVVESYGWSRTKDMLEKGKLGSKKRCDLRRSDEWFMDYSGVGKVLDKYKVEFLNITEEHWAHRTMEPETIKDEVESIYSPVSDPDFYSWMPQRLYDMRGADLLSLSKLRIGLSDIPASLSIKNLFGMIPHPSRWKYHGKKNCILDTSIIDIYKVYDTIFNIKGVVEAVFTHTDTDIEHNKMIIKQNVGFAAASKNTLDLDASVMALCSIEPYQAHVRHASNELGYWNKQLINEIKQQDPIL